MRSKRLTLVFGVALCTMPLTQCGGSSAPEESDAPQAMTPADAGDWPMYRHDLAATGYSPLAEITTSNVADLTAVWTYSLDAEESAGRRPSSQATPIVVDGVMYLPAADRVVALDPDTGSEIWRHPVADGTPSRRGVSYWPGDDATPARIIVTSSTRLLALDAATGASIESFSACET